MTNLSNILRPNKIEDFVGQSHIISKDKILYKLIQKGEIPHLFFYGPPGTGKTTLAKIIAKISNYDYYYFNATSFKTDDLRKIFDRYNNSLILPLIFIDEVHRLNKNQQEVLLPIMEDKSAIILGASTENPFFTLTNAIRSRSFLFEFKSLSKNDLSNILDIAQSNLDIKLKSDSKEYLINSSNGDARAMLNLLEYSYKVDDNVSCETLKELRQSIMSEGSSSSDTHYDLASAMIKSLRGTDIDASIYYLSRLIEAGEHLSFITRRLVVFASEDIGNANPNALNLATNCMLACEKIGYPEARIILSQCVVYLASSPKSNSSYLAINKALNEVKDGKIYAIPNNIKSFNKEYLYPHDYGGYVEQNYINKNVKLYESKNIGFEKTMDDWINKIKSNKN